jgi:hypothetical protein
MWVAEKWSIGELLKFPKGKPRDVVMGQSRDDGKQWGVGWRMANENGRISVVKVDHQDGGSVLSMVVCTCNPCLGYIARP